MLTSKPHLISRRVKNCFVKYSPEVEFVWQASNSSGSNAQKMNGRRKKNHEISHWKKCNKDILCITYAMTMIPNSH
jgi:hypothetical protein